MRVAVFTGEFPVISETFVILQIIGLLELGHDVDIYVDYRPRASGVAHAGVDAFRLLDRAVYMDVPPLHTGQRVLTALGRARVCYRVTSELTASVLNPLTYGRNALSLSALHRLYRLATVHARYDVLHAHFGMVGNRFRFASELWDAPLVVSFHGSDYSVYPRKHGIGCYRSLFETATMITANSDNTRLRLERLGCPPGKIHKLYSAWDMHAFPYMPHPRLSCQPARVLTVGRLVEKKGTEYAIHAVARARETCPHLRLDIVGDGPLRPHLAALVSRLGLDTVVTLHGACAHEDVQRLMAEAHVFMLPSVTAVDGDEEGQGVALVEAQATGLPVLATQHGPFPEVVMDGVSGYLVPERDPVVLAERLIYLIQHPDVAEAMGRAGRRHIEEHFDSRMLSRRVIDIYQWAIARHNEASARTKAGAAGRASRR
jgi:colanic acid/amylovoran biosynthesis glycosyltransferase